MIKLYWAFPGSPKIRLASTEAMNDREIEAQQAGQQRNHMKFS